MIKFLLILFILFYVFTRLGGFIFRTFLSKIFSQQVERTQGYNKQKYTRPTDGNVHIDHIPDKGEQKKSDFEGDYVDYEEVK